MLVSITCVIMIIDGTSEMHEGVRTRYEYKRRGGGRGEEEVLAENLLTQTRSLTGGHAERTEAAVGIRGRGWRRGWCVAPEARR